MITSAQKFQLIDQPDLKAKLVYKMHSYRYPMLEPTRRRHRAWDPIRSGRKRS